MSYQEFVKITKFLEKNYQKQIDNDILKIWYHELKKFSEKDYKKIILEAIKKYKFLPTLAEILEIEILPEWFDKEIEKKEVSKEQKEEMEMMLKEFK